MLPETTPVVRPTGATKVLLVVHVPAAILLSVVVLEIQTPVVPVIAGGLAITVSTFVVKQPVEEFVYVMRAVPAKPALTTPEEMLMLATDILFEVHVPLAGVLLSVIVVFSQGVNVLEVVMVPGVSFA